MRLAPLAFAAIGLLATPVFADGCADEIKSVMSDSMTSGPLHMESTITSDTTSMTMSGDVVPPGNMHMTIDTDGQVVEMIVLGDQAWMKLASDWTELPADAAAEIAKSFDLADTSALEALTDAQCNGTITVDGEDYLSYEWKLTVDGTDTVNAILVDPEDMLPVHMETQVMTAGVESNVVVDYTYDDAIAVTAPM